MRMYLEIRVGAGGEESELFAEEIMIMYLKFANNNNIKSDIINSGKTKVILLDGKESKLRVLENESGVHRVQRIPKNQSRGKIQTSTITVATIMYSDVNKSKVKLNESDLEYQAYRASGAGGQHRNTTDSAIRLIHKPTGTTVICADERSQYNNKIIAKETLLAKLIQLKDEEVERTLNKSRKQQVLSGERSEAKRTYNYQRSEVIDINGKSARLKDIIKKAKLELLC